MEHERCARTQLKRSQLRRRGRARLSRAATRRRRLALSKRARRLGLLRLLLGEGLEEDLARLVARADERPARHVLEPHRHPLLPPILILARRQHARDGHVPLARLKVLAKRDDLDARRERVAHRLPHLSRRLAAAQHEGSLCDHFWRERARAREHRERLAVGGAAVAHGGREALDRLQVVRKDVEPSRRDERDAREVAAKVG
mmetsp:Transcript_18580/g.57912  ORF Transcript_18580/g.57912 Transcript_18580/m.57912 type:complete len:202 (-) Transcript_18580:552-1157(-)